MGDGGVEVKLGEAVVGSMVGDPVGLTAGELMGDEVGEDRTG